MSLLEWDIIRKERVEMTQMEPDAGDSKKYKVEAIWDNAVYAKKLDGHLLELYYLVL